MISRLSQFSAQLNLKRPFAVQQLPSTLEKIPRKLNVSRDRGPPKVDDETQTMKVDELAKPLQASQASK
jgi:hypothetical protein